MALGRYLHSELALVLPGGVSRDELLAELARAAHTVLTSIPAEELHERLRLREEQGATSTPEGVAFPHVVAPDIERTLVIIAKLERGVDFGVSGHPPADLVLAMFGDAGSPWEHVRLLARLARICRTDEARGKLRAAKTPEELYEALLAEDRSHD